MNNDIKSILISEEEIDEITTRLAADIDLDYGDGRHNLVLVCILKGSIMFTGALMGKIRTPAQIEFMKVSSYGSQTVSSGCIHVKQDIGCTEEELKSKDILIIEDIVDSGRTLKLLTALLEERGAKSVKTCTMLNKPSRRVVDFTPDYIGADIPDEFVVGFGLDYDENYRNLPYVGILKPEVYGRAR